jgi:hypothetical protein
MNIASDNINNIFYKALNLSHDVTTYEGKWVQIHLQSWIDYASNSLANITSSDTVKLERLFVDFLKNKIFEANYGSGCFYEIYERRRQDEARVILSSLNLNDDDLSYFKNSVEIIDDESYSISICEECDTEFSNRSSHLIHSLAIGGQELCHSCFNSYF